MLYEGDTFNLTAHYGGGLLGSAVLLANNAERPGALNGGLLLHRRWANNIFYDLMCSDMPNLQENDPEVTKEFNTFKAQKSELSFRTNRTCLRCHTSIDNLAHVARNVRINDMLNNTYERIFYPIM